MGTDYTSFSPLTQDWNDDPASIFDSRGRQVCLMPKPPADWCRSPKYGPLVYDGYVLLSHLDEAVKDIPGLPLTLESDPPAWLLVGLKRCVEFTTYE